MDALKLRALQEQDNFLTVWLERRCSPKVDGNTEDQMDREESGASGTSLLSPRRKPATQQPVPEQPAKTAKFVPPPSSLTHKIVMGSAIVVPFVGLLVGIALTWAYGFMSIVRVGKPSALIRQTFSKSSSRAIARPLFSAR